MSGKQMFAKVLLRLIIFHNRGEILEKDCKENEMSFHLILN